MVYDIVNPFFQKRFMIDTFQAKNIIKAPEFYYKKKQAWESTCPEELYQIVKDAQQNLQLSSLQTLHTLKVKNSNSNNKIKIKFAVMPFAFILTSS